MADAFDTSELHAVADCSKHHVDAQLQSLSESVAPVNRLIALLNVFMQLVGLGPLPDLSSLGSDAAAALQPLEDGDEPEADPGHDPGVR